MVDGVPVAELLASLEQTAPDALAQKFNVAPAQIETALQWLRYHHLLPGQESRRSAP